jgi:hypothetical protein
MLTLSDDAAALQDADDLLRQKIDELYVQPDHLGRAFRYLPRDASTDAAHGALVGACEYIKRLMRTHVTGRASSGA